MFTIETSGDPKLRQGVDGEKFATLPFSWMAGSAQRTYVMLTPSSHKIYSILGVGSVANKEAGMAQQLVIMGLLRWQYGDKSKPALAAAGAEQRIDQGGRHVIFRVTEAAGEKVELRYLDSDLEKLAATERLGSQKWDDFGL